METAVPIEIYWIIARHLAVSFFLTVKTAISELTMSMDLICYCLFSMYCERLEYRTVPKVVEFLYCVWFRLWWIKSWAMGHFKAHWPKRKPVSFGPEVQREIIYKPSEESETVFCVYGWPFWSLLALWHCCLKEDLGLSIPEWTFCIPQCMDCSTAQKCFSLFCCLCIIGSFDAGFFKINKYLNKRTYYWLLLLITLQP